MLECRYVHRHMCNCIPFKMYIFTFIIANTLKEPFKEVLDITKMYIFTVIFANSKKYLLQWFGVLGFFRCCNHAFATLCLKSYSPRENQSSARKCASADTDNVSSRGLGSAGALPRISPLSKAVANVVYTSLFRYHTVVMTAAVVPAAHTLFGL